MDNRSALGWLLFGLCYICALLVASISILGVLYALR